MNRARDQYSITEAGLGAKRKNVKSCTGVYTAAQKEDKHSHYNGRAYNVFRQQRQRSRSNYRCKEIEEGESSKSLTKDAKCKVLNLLVRNAETNFGRQSLSHHYVEVSSLEECIVKVAKENREEIYSQDNLRLERTRCNTPKYLRAHEFRRFKQCLGKPRVICSVDVELWLNSIRESQLAGREFTRTSSTWKELKNSQAWCSAVTDASFHCQ